MASQAKRIRIYSSVTEDDANDDFCTKVKEEASEDEVQQRHAVNLAVGSLSDIQIKEDPLFLSEQSCSRSQVIQDPSGLSTVAVLTSKITEELSSDEQDSDSDNDSDSSNSDDQDNELKDFPDQSWFPWNNDSSSMTFIPFTRPLPDLVPLTSQPHDILRLFLDDELLNMITDETNKCGTESTKYLWKDITRNELLKFMGLIIHTGTIRLHLLSDYWKTHYLFNITCFSKFMSRNRFLQILKCLSFSSAPYKKRDRLARIQPIIDRFNEVMKSNYCPVRNLIISETMSLHKGQLLLRDFFNIETLNCSQHRGLSLHVLEDKTGVAFKLKVYFGKFQPKHLVLGLLEENLDFGHSVYLNEQYNSIKLAATLLERRTHCTGPLPSISAANSNGLSYLLKCNENIVPTDTSYYQNGVHVLKTKKKFYVSTEYDKELKEVPINNRDARGAFHEDFNAFYPCQSNRLKWHKKLFIHVLHLAVINSYHLHTKLSPNAKKGGFYDFRLQILEWLLPNEARQSFGKHILTKIEKVRFRTRQERGRTFERKEVVRKECKGCKTEKKRTTFECRQCVGAPGFCKDCFIRTHSLDNI